LNSDLAVLVRKISQVVQKIPFVLLGTVASTQYSEPFEENSSMLSFLIPLKCRCAQYFRRVFKNSHHITRIAEFRRNDRAEEDLK